MSTSLDASAAARRPVNVHRKPVGVAAAPNSIPRLPSQSSSLTQSPPTASTAFEQQLSQRTSPTTGSRQYPPVSLQQSALRANSMQQYQTPYQQQQQLNQQAMPKPAQYYPIPLAASTTMPLPPVSQQQQHHQPQQHHHQQQYQQQHQQQQQYNLQQQQYQQQQQQQPSATRRTLSNATSSTASSYQGSTILASNPSYTSSIRRSTSSRRNPSQTSYVALLRKQKATVWCDRAQHEDPRAQAQLKAAKQRAQRELAGGPRNGRSGGTASGGLTGGVRNKIRHHGAVKASAYSAANLSGAGVPVRLSATEVDDDDDSSEDEREVAIANYEQTSQHQLSYHERNGSGRSSMGSNPRLGSINLNNGRSSSSIGPESFGMESSGNAYNIASPPNGTENREDATPMPTRQPGTGVDGGQQADYFARPKRANGAAPGSDDSVASNNSIGDERDFGHVAALPQRQQPNPEAAAKTAEELRRRGSVDDRTMTMSAGRLFIANPDCDSD